MLVFENEIGYLKDIKINQVLEKMESVFPIKNGNYHVRFKTISDYISPKIEVWIDIANLNARAPFVLGAVYMRILKL